MQWQLRSLPASVRAALLTAFGPGFPLDVVAEGCPPLHALVQALHCLPMARPAAAAPLPPDLARDAPVWGNLLVPPPPGEETPPEWRFYNVFTLTTLATVQDVWEVRGVQRWPELDAARGVAVAAHLNGLVAALPAAWYASCSRAPRAAADVEAGRRAALAAVLARLELPCAVGAATSRAWRLDSVPPVRVLTAMQHDAAAAKRSEKLPDFLADAAAPPGFTARHLQRRMAAVWRLPWENQHKELFWRLPLNGVAIYGSDRYRHPVRGSQCCCAGGSGGRAHNFWQCPVAAAVRHSLAAALRPLSAAVVLQRHHIWLAEPPLPALSQGVWHVVALSALHAMDVGRRLLAAVCWERGLSRAPPAVLQQACLKAVDSLWGLVADFAKLHSAGLPSRWSPRRLPLTHPFLHACPLAVGSHGLRVTQPPLDAGAAVVCDLVLRSHASFVLRLDALPNDL